MNSLESTNTKICTKCGESKSLDSFNKSKKAKGGFKEWCRSCTLAAYYESPDYKRQKSARLLKEQTMLMHWRKEGSPEKFCGRCDETKPTYAFSKDSYRNDGLAAWCRDCTKKRKKLNKETRPERQALTDKGLKKCTVCGQIKKLEYFRVRKAKGRIVFISYCIKCERQKNREYQTQIKDETSITNHERRVIYPEKVILTSVRNRAKSRNLEFNLDQEFIDALWLSQCGKCSVSGIPFDLLYSKNSSVKQNPLRPSLDRINNDLGYLKGNVRFVLWIVNLGISNYGEDLYKEVCSAVYKNNKGL